MLENESKNYCFIDGQNLYLGIDDLGWDLDYYRFRYYLLAKYNIKKAYLFLGFVSENQNVYNHLRKCGFDLVFKKVAKGKNGKVKGNIDVHLTLKTVDMLGKYDKAMLVTSDGDFAVLVDYLKKKQKFGGLISPVKKKCSHLLQKEAGMRILFLEDVKEKVNQKKKRASDR